MVCFLPTTFIYEAFSCTTQRLVNLLSNARIIGGENGETLHSAHHTHTFPPHRVSPLNYSRNGSLSVSMPSYYTAKVLLVSGGETQSVCLWTIMVPHKLTAKTLISEWTGEHRSVGQCGSFFLHISYMIFVNVECIESHQWWFLVHTVS